MINYSSKSVWGLAGVAALGVLSANAAVLDLTTAGSSGTINNAFFQQVPDQSTGTGVIDPFVRISSIGNETFEGAYNTSSSLTAPFGQHGGVPQFNHDLLLSDVRIKNIGGVSYYEFLLDLNESGNTPSADAKVTLNQIQIFRTSVPGQTGGSIDSLTGRLITTGFTGTSVYDLNSGGGVANSVVLDYGLNAGSGSGDMFMYVPIDNFAGATGDYVVLYSHFGNPPGEFRTDGGFEEWSRIIGPSDVPVPEPATVIAGSLLLLPFAASMVRRFRKQ